MNVPIKTLITLIGHLLIYSQGLILTTLIIKASGPEIYGAYSLLITSIGIVFSISSIGVGISAKRWLPSANEKSKRREIYYPQLWFNLISSTLVGILSGCGYYYLSDLTQLNYLDIPAWYIGIYLVVYTVFSQTVDYYRYTHRVFFYNIATVMQPYILITIILVAYLYGINLSIRMILLAMIISLTMISCIAFISIIKEIGFIIKLIKIKDLYNEIKLGLPLIFVYLTDIILVASDRYIIAIFISIKHVGIYVPAYVIGTLTILLPKVFGVVLQPIISKNIDEGHD
jgi:O-antigen/teichoic acid export membrane protein